MRLDREHFKQAFWVSLARMAGGLTASLATLVLAISLSASGVGQYASSMAVALMVTPVAQLSARVGAVAVGASVRASRHSVLGAARTLLVRASAVAAVIGVVAVLATVEPSLWFVALGALLVLPAGSIQSYNGVEFWLKGLVAGPDLATAGQSLLRLGGFGVLALLGKLSPGSGVAVSVVAVWAAAIAARSQARRLPAVETRSGRLAPGALRAACIPATVAALALGALLRIDVIMLGLFDRSDDEIGRYAMSASVLEISWVAAIALGQVFFVSAAGRSTAVEQSSLSVVKRSCLMSAFSLAVGLVLFGLMSLIGERLLDDSYKGIAVLMAYALPGVAMYAMIPVIRSHMFLDRRFWEVGTAMIAGLVVNVALNLILIPSLGAKGAAVATSGGYTTAALVLVAFARNSLGSFRRSSILG